MYIYKLDGETTKAAIITPDIKGCVGYLRILIGDKFLTISDFSLERVEPSMDILETIFSYKISTLQTEEPYWLIRFKADKQIIPLAPEFRFDSCVNVTTPPSSSSQPPSA